MAPCLHRQSNALVEGTRGTLWLRCTRRLGYWRVVGGTGLRLILIIGHNLTVSLYSFFEFLADVAGRLLRHGASFEKEDRECQTDCAKTSHPHQFSVLSPKYEVFRGQDNRGNGHLSAILMLMVSAISVTSSEPIPEEATQMPEQSGFTRSGGSAIETSQNLGEYFAIFHNIIKEA